MRLVVLTLGATAAQSHFFSPDKFKSLMTACEGLNTLANCSATMTGVCQTRENGVRTCGCEHHSQFMHNMKEMAGAVMGHGQWHHHHHEHHEHIGDCGSKKDGEACSFHREGQCVPSGKCPIFKGEMVCRPNDAHAPDFVTAPCKGKNVGDDCENWHKSGKCVKPQYMLDMYCKVDHHFGEFPKFQKPVEEKPEKPEKPVEAEAKTNSLVDAVFELFPEQSRMVVV